jgi:hypothetical protein
LLVLAMELSGCPRLEGLSGGDSGGEPPVPIPNTEVKPTCADGTWGATPWESRSLPDIKRRGVTTSVDDPSFSLGEQMARPEKGHKRGRPQRSQQADRGKTGHRSVTTVTSGQLPKWVRDEIIRSTAKDRREPALMHLSKGMQHFADERYKAALPELRKAKELSPRSSMVRELLGLSAYRAGLWEEGLREIRTFRRITGEMIHTPVELDCLRALKRGQDITKVWQMIQEGDVTPETQHEARVVYASHLLDEGKPREAWAVIKPGRLVATPSMAELRRWFVAARVAVAAGDLDAARRLLDALDAQEPDFEGIDELRSALI